LESANSNFTNPTLILIESGKSTEPKRSDHADQFDQKIWQSVQLLGQHLDRAQVLLVRAPNSAETKTSYRPIPKSFNCIGQAIEAAKHDEIAIVDANVKLTSNAWSLLRSESQQHSIQTLFHSGFKATKPKQILLWLYTLIIRMLFQVKKTEWRPGITLLKRSSVEAILQGTPEDQRIDSSTQLLAMAKLNRLPVREIELGEAQNSPEIIAPYLKSNKILRSGREAFKLWYRVIMFPRTRHQVATDDGPKPKKPAQQFLAVTTLILLAGFVLFKSLGYPLFEPDEVRNAQLALNVLETGDWLSLRLGNEAYWDKPPLQVWAIATSYKIFGVSQFATRLPIAIASLLTILLMVFAGKRLIGFRAAAIGTLLLLLTTGFLFTSRYVTMDASLTAMTTATLLFGYLAVANKFKRTSAVLAGIACGTGVLLKGPIIGVLCLPPLLVANWLSSNQSPTVNQTRTRNRYRLLWFLIPAMLIAAPWFIAMALVHPDFLGYFFWKHHVVRFSSAFNHREPFWYYAIGIFLFMFPASYLLPSVFRFMTSRRPENRLWRTQEHGFLFLTAIWIIGFFTLSESKLPTYIVPAFPPICLLMGVLIERRVLQTELSKNLCGLIPLVGANNLTSKPNRRKTFFDRLPGRVPTELVLWIGLGSVLMLTKFYEYSANLSVMIASAIALGAGSWLSLRKQSTPKFRWACFSFVALFAATFIVHRVVPAMATSRSIHLAAQRLKSESEFDAGTPLVFYGREPYGISLVHDPGNVVHFQQNQTAKLVDFLKRNPSAIIVSSDEPMETLRAGLPWTIALQECENGRHLYTSRPNPSVIAQDQTDSLIR